MHCAIAGIQNALVISRTEVGQRGSAGRWPSGRGIRGVITHSPPLGDPRHTALLSLLNITMVDWAGEQFRALEACAKCKTFQVRTPCQGGKQCESRCCGCHGLAASCAGDQLWLFSCSEADAMHQLCMCMCQACQHCGVANHAPPASSLLLLAVFCALPA
jgi:hypothetical protein